jgi:hypothetical protein
MLLVIWTGWGIGLYIWTIFHIVWSRRT